MPTGGAPDFDDSRLGWLLSRAKDLLKKIFGYWGGV